MEREDGESMKIYEELKLDLEKGEIISIIGGGGKTTSLFLLAEELKGLGKKLMVTTTTAIYNPREGYDYHYLDEIPKSFIPSPASITVYGRKIDGRKLLGEDTHNFREIIGRQVFDFVLIEADGAKCKPIKAAASHEPVIIDLTTKTLAVIGLDSFDRRIDNVVHRPEIFGKIVGKEACERISVDDIVNLALDERGTFKGAIGEKILLLNKAIDKKSISAGKEIRKRLLDRGFAGKVILTDILSKKFY